MDSVLFHWGIKGQKWGLRRFQFPDGRLTDEGKKRYAKGKHLSEFSDSEIDRFIDRLRKEDTLVKYLRSIKSDEISSGKKFAEEFLSSYGKGLGANLGKATVDGLEGAVKGIANVFKDNDDGGKRNNQSNGVSSKSSKYTEKLSIGAYDSMDKIINNVSFSNTDGVTNVFNYKKKK